MADQMITKRFGEDFHSPGGALTLDENQVSESLINGGRHSRTHPSGWTIEGEVHEDYYTWVNEFSATHPEYGRVWGDFENEVNADSEEAFQHFIEHHPPSAWDYMDI
jgi:hypothetical protein